MTRALAALALLAPLAAPDLAFAQARNVGPGVADRSATLLRGGSDAIVFGGEVQVSVEGDWNGRNSPRQGYYNIYTESLVAAYLMLPYGFSLFGVARLEQPDNTALNQNLLFARQTLWVDELYLTWSAGIVDIYGGKIHPRFGSAWDQGPGLYGTDLGRQYELTEKMGFGARLWLSDIAGVTRAIGSHVWQTEVFTADRTELSGQIGQRRWSQTITSVDPGTGETTERTRLLWRNALVTGNADNAPFASGIVSSLIGYGIPMPRGQAGYQFSWSQRKPGEDAEAAGRAGNEAGFTASAFWTIPLPWRLTAVPYIEYAQQNTANGYLGQRNQYLTVGGSLRYTPFTLDYAFQQLIASDTRAGSHQTNVEQAVSVTYDLYFLAPTPILRPLTLTVGARRVREDGVGYTGVGAALGWLWRW